MHRHQDHAPDKACLIQFTFVIKNLSTKNRNVTRSGNTTCTKTACLMMPSVRGAAHGATERERFFTVCSKRAHSAYTPPSQVMPSNGDTSFLHIIFPFGLCIHDTFSLSIFFIVTYPFGGYAEVHVHGWVENLQSGPSWNVLCTVKLFFSEAAFCLRCSISGGFKLPSVHSVKEVGHLKLPSVRGATEVVWLKLSFVCGAKDAASVAFCLRCDRKHYPKLSYAAG